MLVIPLSWASLWPDPAFGAAILEKQATYCIEAMNGVEWLKGKVESEGLETEVESEGVPAEFSPATSFSSFPPSTATRAVGW